MKKAVTSAEDSGVVSAATAKSPTRKNQDPDYKAANKDKKITKVHVGDLLRKVMIKRKGVEIPRKRNKDDTTPKKIVVIKTERNKDTASPTDPAVTHQ